MDPYLEGDRPLNPSFCPHRLMYRNIPAYGDKNGRSRSDEIRHLRLVLTIGMRQFHCEFCSEQESRM